MFTMRGKSEAHEVLYLGFHRDSVPPHMIVDGSKEQAEGDFHASVRKMDVT